MVSGKRFDFVRRRPPIPEEVGVQVLSQEIDLFAMRLIMSDLPFACELIQMTL